MLYVLIDPRTLCGRYIGITSNPRLNARLSAHVSEARSARVSHKLNWLRELLSLGLRPLMEVLAVFPDRETAADEEIWWISIHRAMEPGLLTNTTDGGEGVLDRSGAIYARIVSTRRKNGSYIPSLDTRDKMSKAKKGKPLSLDHRRSLRTVVTDEMEDSIVARYVNGTTISDIASSEDLSTCAIDGVLSRNSIAKRTISEIHRTYPSRPGWLLRMKEIGTAQMSGLSKIDRMRKFGDGQRLERDRQAVIVAAFIADPSRSYRALGALVNTNHHTAKRTLMLAGLVA